MSKKIYLDTDQEFKNIKELLEYGYSKNNEFVETYSNRKCTNEECHPARRSFGDLLLICKTYFPETTEEELAKMLFKLNKSYGIRASFCGTINKVVFLKDLKGVPMGNGVHYNEDRKGYGTHSYNEIVKLSKNKK